jgi:hypothetical protein
MVIIRPTIPLINAILSESLFKFPGGLPGGGLDEIDELAGKIPASIVAISVGVRAKTSLQTPLAIV